MLENASPFDRDEMRQMMAKWAIDCGARLKQRRVDLGFSRSLLADLAGVSAPSVSRLEAGAIRPKDDLRWVLAECLLCSADEIWTTPDRSEIAAMKIGTAAHQPVPRGNT